MNEELSLQLFAGWENYNLRHVCRTIKILVSRCVGLRSMNPATAVNSRKSDRRATAIWMKYTYIRWVKLNTVGTHMKTDIVHRSSDEISLCRRTLGLNPGLLQHLQWRRSNHSARSHLQLARSHLQLARSHQPLARLSLNSARSHPLLSCWSHSQLG